MSFISDIARSLYDGGWRCEDLKDIVEEYEICSELKFLERDESNENCSEEFRN